MQSTAAYDLSRFEVSKPREHAQTKKPKLQAVKGNKKAKTSVLTKVSPVTLVLVAMISAFVCAYMLYTQAMITQTTAEIARVNNEITQLKSESVRLDSELDAIMSRGNIEEKALALGMYQADKLQVEGVEVNQGDKIEVLSDNRTFFEKIADFFSILF